MATHTAKILTQAQLAKAPMFDELETAYQRLAAIPLEDALRCVPDYLAAVANIVDIDLREVLDHFLDADCTAREKRKLLMDYLRDCKELGPECGPFLRNLSRLMVNVQ